MHKKVKLISKRNEVFRIVEDDKTYILKKFANNEKYMREKEILGVLKEAGVKVPAIIKAQDDCLFLEDLGQLSFLDWYEKQENYNIIDTAVLHEFCSWLKSFYSVVFDFYNDQLILFDVNFKNFIIVGKKIYGIDFEQTKTGCINEDAGKLSAFALTYDPPMTEWKINFRTIFIDILSKELNIDREKIIAEEKKELTAIEKRRNIKKYRGEGE